jgi:hypothetical protein
MPLLSLRAFVAYKEGETYLPVRFVCLFVSMGVRGKPRMYYSLLSYCTSRFGRSNFAPRLLTRSAL